MFTVGELLLLMRKIVMRKGWSIDGECLHCRCKQINASGSRLGLTFRPAMRLVFDGMHSSFALLVRLLAEGIE